MGDAISDLTHAERNGLRVAAQWPTVDSALATDAAAGTVSGRTAHSLARRGLLRAIASHPHWVTFEITEVAMAQLASDD
jgi:hypothetical protein